MPITIGADKPSTSPLPPEPLFSRSPSVGGVLIGLAEMVFGAGFLLTWFNPAILGPEWVKLALELMLLEFILIHSGPFLGMASAKFSDSRRRWMATGGLALMYSLFVLGFCLSLETWRPMLSFWIITVQRMAGTFLDPKPNEEAKAWLMAEIAVSALLYLLLAMVTTILPVPRFGLTGDLSGEVAGDTGGLWVEAPQKVVVLAGLYYLFRGYFTAKASPRRVGKWNPKAS
jgi:hypothetical protein